MRFTDDGSEAVVDEQVDWAELIRLDKDSAKKPVSQAPFNGFIEIGGYAFYIHAIPIEWDTDGGQISSIGDEDAEEEYERLMALVDDEHALRTVTVDGQEYVIALTPGLA